MRNTYLTFKINFSAIFKFFGCGIITPDGLGYFEFNLRLFLQKYITHHKHIHQVEIWMAVVRAGQLVQFSNVLSHRDIRLRPQADLIDRLQP